MRFWGWTRPPPILSQGSQEDQELLQKHEAPGFGIQDYQAASVVSLSPLGRRSVMVMGADPFGATLWAPTGPTAGHPPSTAGRAPCRQGRGQCWTLHPCGGSQGGSHGAPWRTIFESPFPSSIKALCSPCQLSSAGLALTSPSQGFGGLKLHPSLFLGCLHALSSLTSKASVTVSAMCSFQCCVHIVSCSILTPCQPWMSPIH